MIAKFYMNDATLKAVLQEISSHTKRPRGDDRNKYRTDVFVKVWNIIFPKDKFPDFNEPLSACMYFASSFMSLSYLCQ